MRVPTSWIIVAAVGCGGDGGDASVDAVVAIDGPPIDAALPPDAELRLDPTPGHYRAACDGSGAIAIDADHFLAVYDEDQALRIYRRGADAEPVQAVDVDGDLATGGGEADLEDLARDGDRLYAITSHGRNTDGDLDRDRYRFAAFDLAGEVPALAITFAGASSTLLDDMLVRGNWVTPDDDVIAALTASSQLDDDHDPDLPPELEGTNVEGLALAPSSGNPGRMVIGFRNPQPAGRAIVISLENAAAVIGGAPAQLGAAALWDLDGLGIRALAWSPTHAAVLVIAGPHDGGGPFRLYRWSGDLAAAPVAVAELDAPPSSAPEAIAIYPDTRDVQITFDQGDADIGGVPCKEAAEADRVFTDVIVGVE